MSECRWGHSYNLGVYCWQKHCRCKFNYHENNCLEFKEHPTKEEMKEFEKKMAIERKKGEIKVKEAMKRKRKLAEEAEKLYWEHVEPENIKDEELKQALIDKIISEKKANQIFD